MPIKVAYQGTEASFSQMAIEKYFGAGAECMGKIAFDDVFISLEKGEVDLAALPVENSLIGPIIENFDLIARHDVAVVGELCLPIQHCLVAKKGQKMEQIKKVFSHPKALAQCTGFFQAHPFLESVVHFDTAGAAKEVSEGSDPSIAAIGSRKTAEVYGLEILKSNLEDDRSNTTRFLFLKKGSMTDLERREGKCSLLFTLKHVRGSLAAVLKVMAEHGLNLTQIVSRPIREKPFEYLFFVDSLFSRDVDMFKFLNAFKNETQTLKLLGLYEPAK